MSEPSNIRNLEDYRSGGGNDGVPEVPTDFALTDIGNARRFAQQHGEDFRFCAEFNKWLVWDSCRWTFDLLGERHRRGEETALRLFDDTELCRDYKARLAFASQSCDSKRMKAMLDMARWQGQIPVRASDFDRNPYFFNTRTGTVNLLTGEVHEPCREDLLLKYSPVEFDAEAECPRWLEFLKTIFEGNEETISFVRRAIGYSLCGSIEEEALFILYGTGANGKTTLIETLQSVIADYGTVAPIELLLKTKAPADSERLFAPLAGVRFLTVTEPEQNDRLAMGRIKRMTGGDTLCGRYLYGEQFKYHPQFKIWLLTNHPPNLSEIGSAVERRLKLIPFAVEIKNPDKKLKQFLIENERPGILNWCLQGAREWREQGLGECPSVTNATAKMMAAADLVQRFCEECCTVGPLQEVSSTLLYRTFTEWCKENREYAVKSAEFRERLKKMLKLEPPASNGKLRVWRGINLNAIGSIATVPGAKAVEESNKLSDEWDDANPKF